MITVLVDEPLIQATTYIPLMDKSDSGTLEKREPVEVVKHNVNEGIQKSSGKKLKNETDKGKKLKIKSWHSLMANFNREEGRILSDVMWRRDLREAFVAAGCSSCVCSFLPCRWHCGKGSVPSESFQL